MKLNCIQRLKPFEPVVTVDAYLEARRVGATDIERRFLSQLRLRNGVFKVTYERRLDDTAELLVQHVVQLRAGIVRVLDVACSSGISTVELHETLRRAGLRAQTVGTDLVTAGRYVALGGDGILFDSNDAVLQIECDGWATPWYWRRRETIAHPILQARTHARGWVRARRLRAALRCHDAGVRTVDVPFVCSQAASTPGVSIVEEDLARPRENVPFHVIRAANILNRQYFPETRLRQMIELLLSRLADDGLLLVTRTDGEINRGSLFAVRAGAPIEIDQLNGGSEVRDVVLDTRSRRRAVRERS